MEDKYTHTTKRTGHRHHHRYKGQTARTTHNKSPPAVHIGNGQTIAGDTHRTAASRNTSAVHPRIEHITDTPPNTVSLNNSIKQTSQMLRSHRRDVTIPILQRTTTILSDENLIMAAIG